MLNVTLDPGTPKGHFQFLMTFCRQNKRLIDRKNNQLCNQYEINRYSQPYLSVLIWTVCSFTKEQHVPLAQLVAEPSLTGLERSTWPGAGRR